MSMKAILKTNGNQKIMATEIRVPTLGESVTEATIGTWFKQVGDAIATDEAMVELGDRQGDD